MERKRERGPASGQRRRFTFLHCGGIISPAVSVCNNGRGGRGGKSLACGQLIINKQLFNGSLDRARKATRIKIATKGAKRGGGGERERRARAGSRWNTRCTAPCAARLSLFYKRDRRPKASGTPPSELVPVAIGHSDYCD